MRSDQWCASVDPTDYITLASDILDEAMSAARLRRWVLPDEVDMPSPADAQRPLGEAVPAATVNAHDGDSEATAKSRAASGGSRGGDDKGHDKGVSGPRRRSARSGRVVSATSTGELSSGAQCAGVTPFLACGAHEPRRGRQLVSFVQFLCVCLFVSTVCLCVCLSLHVCVCMRVCLLVYACA